MRFNLKVGNINLIIINWYTLKLWISIYKWSIVWLCTAKNKQQVTIKYK